MPAVIDPDEFPLLGEPLPVEFANSLYLAAGRTIDFLATVTLTKTWFDLAATGIDMPNTVRRADAESIRELRNTIHAILGDLAAGRTAAADTVDVLNQYAARAPWFLRLGWDDAHEPEATRQHTVGGIDALLGRIATETIDLVTGPTRLLLRQCNGPGCAMLFVKNHHRRRWCHQSCGHRARQANYYRRKKILIAHRT